MSCTGCRFSSLGEMVVSLHRGTPILTPNVIILTMGHNIIWHCMDWEIFLNISCFLITYASSVLGAERLRSLGSYPLLRRTIVLTGPAFQLPGILDV